MKFLDLTGTFGRAPRPSRRNRRGGSKPPSRRFVPGVLCGLEERVVLSSLTFTVTTTADAGVGSLRAQVINANNNPGDDTIVFSLPANSTINLTSGVLDINPTTADDSLIVDAGNNPVTINALNNTANSNPQVNQGIFRVQGTGDVKLGSLILKNALKQQNGGSTGGAVDDTGSGTLWLSKDTFLGNRADRGGAVSYNPAIAGTGSLVVDQCQFGQLVGGTPDASAANQAGFEGGAIYFNNVGLTLGSLQVSNSQFYGNLANNTGAADLSNASGGAIYDLDLGPAGSMSILASTFNGNRAIGRNGGGAAGGAVYTPFGGLSNNTIDGTTFVNNEARGGDANGVADGGNAFGGAVLDGSNATVYSNDSFGQPNAGNGNRAVGGSANGTMGNGGSASGGAIYTAPVTLNISNGTTFYGNQSNGGNGAGFGGGGDGRGGAFYAIAGVPSTVNGLYYSNSASGGVGGAGGGGGGVAQGGAIYTDGPLSLDLAGFFGNAAYGGAGRGAGGGGAALGASLYSSTFAITLADSTVLFSVAIGGAGGGAGGFGGDAYGAVYLNNQALSVVNTQFLNNLSLGGAGGNATAAPETTATAGAGGSAEGAVAGAQSMTVARTSFRNNVAQGGPGGTGSGVGTGIGRGGPGGQAAGGAIFFDQSDVALSGALGTTTFAGNVATGGAGGDSTTMNGRGGAGGDAAGAALYINSRYALLSVASFDGNQTTGGAGGNATNASGQMGTGGNGGAALGGAVEVVGSVALAGVSVSNNKATGGKGGGIGGFIGFLGAGGNAYGGGISVGGFSTPVVPFFAPAFNFAPARTIILIINGTPVLISLPDDPDYIINNTAQGGAAGASLADSRLSGTGGSGMGGGFYNDGTTDLVANVITGNAALGGSNGYGGGDFNDSDGTFILTFCTVTNNTATNPTGADLYNNGGDTFLHASTAGSTAGWPGQFKGCGCYYG